VQEVHVGVPVLHPWHVQPAVQHGAVRGVRAASGVQARGPEETPKRQCRRPLHTPVPRQTMQQASAPLAVGHGCLQHRSCVNLPQLGAVHVDDGVGGVPER
jgi:hypothetical protein